MTVQELIVELEKFHPQALVCVYVVGGEATADIIQLSNQEQGDEVWLYCEPSED